MKVWKSDLDFETVLDTDNELKKYLNKKEISKILDLKHATRRTDYIFKKVFK
jgi:adenylosuccinate lyase